MNIAKILLVALHGLGLFGSVTKERFKGRELTIKDVQSTGAAVGLHGLAMVLVVIA